ncbi:hypothetical protein FACS1894156_4460 [Bacteroidia bacterium]|nr:hypothetical protein FACS1894156_4460 [Bacteroidia bacterium]
MENTTLPERKREPRAWIYENGIKSPFVYVKKSDKISKTGMYIRNHPPVGITEDEIRAIHFQEQE